MHDVIVVGGGPSGAATAFHLARRGFSVRVLDRDRFPREKACGEGLLPHGAAALARLGPLPLPVVPVPGLRFRSGVAEAFLPFPAGHGLAVRRWELDRAIRGAAAAAGADLEPARVFRVERGRAVTDRGDFEARCLVGADGVNSVVPRAFGVSVRRSPDRMGLAGHLRGMEPAPRTVEVVLFGRGELYLSPVGPGLTLAALLAHRDAGLRPADHLPLVRRLLGPRAASARPVGRVLAAAPLATRAARPAGPGWFLVGDAAGRIDPVSGQGLSVALLSAELAADAVEAALRGTAAPAMAAAGYARRLAALRAPLERVTRLLLGLSRHPRLARILLERPDRLRPLVRMAVGEPVSVPGAALAALRGGA